MGHLRSLQFRSWEMSPRAVTLPAGNILLLFLSVFVNRLHFSHNEDGKWNHEGQWQLRGMDILSGDSVSPWSLWINRHLLVSFIRDDDMMPAKINKVCGVSSDIRLWIHAILWHESKRPARIMLWDAPLFKAGNTIAHLCSLLETEWQMRHELCWMWSGQSNEH